MKTYCESCLPKQELFTLEDVEHIIEHVLGIDLPDALRMVQETHKYHENLKNLAMDKRITEQVSWPVFLRVCLSELASVSTPCWDCKQMMPALLHINEARRDD